MKLKFELTIEQVNAIIQQLGNGQFNIVAPLINTLIEQGNKQTEVPEQDASPAISYL